jgi:hypothetical protein
MPLPAARPLADASLLALMLVLAACDRPMATSPSPGGSPAASSAQAARTTGAFVFHGDVPGGLLMIDFDRERTLLIGNTAAQLADICATGVLPEQVTEHDVLSPNGTLHVLIQAKSLPAAVWPILTIDPCADLLGVPPLAEGTAHGVYTDNDLFDSAPGAGSFGITARGRLIETATGRPVQLDAKFRNVFLPDGTIKLPVNYIILR